MNKYEFEKALWASDMPTNAKIVALAYAYHSNWKTGGGIYVSQVGVADKTGLSKNTVSRWTKWLKDEGWLVPTDTLKNNVTVYELGEVSQPLGNQESPDESQVSQPLGEVSQPLGQVSQPLSTNVTELYKNFTKEADASTSDTSTEGIKGMDETDISYSEEEGREPIKPDLIEDPMGYWLAVHEGRAYRKSGYKPHHWDHVWALLQDEDFEPNFVEFNMHDARTIAARQESEDCTGCDIAEHPYVRPKSHAPKERPQRRRRNLEMAYN